MLAPEEDEVVALGWDASVVAVAVAAAAAAAAAATASLATVDPGTFALK